MLDYLIKNGTIINGKNEAPYVADLGIKGGKIVKIGEISEEAAEVIDAEGYVVTPGFIDIHCHSDAIIFAEGKNQKRLWQGVTTELIGNCGISAAPVKKEHIADLRKYNDPFYSKIPVAYEEWNSFAEYLDYVEKTGPVLNTAALVGHGALRVAMAGFENRKITGEELENMKKLLGRCMEQGAFGMSSGLIYPPGIYADEEEIRALVSVVKSYGGLYATHMRSESEHLEDSVRNVLELAKATGVNLEISHHKAMGIHNFGKVSKTIPMIEQCRKEGYHVDCDTYPYTACSTQFSAVLPPWAFEGGVQALLERLESPTEREKLIADMKEENMKYESYYQLAGWENILINECSVAEYAGKTVAEIADKKGKDPFEMALDILKESKNEAMMICFCISEEDVKTSYRSEASMVCTDGFPAIGKSHPRYLGSFVRVLEKYVKQEAVLSLPEAIYKMTGKPAGKIGLKDRGVLEEGKEADILIMDMNSLHDNADYEQSDALAEGMKYIWINGVKAMDDGKCLNVCAGKVLRK